jgi:hypothetical protein
MYEKLGAADGPNVTWKVIVAFLVPIFIFIGTLAGSQKLLKPHLDEPLLTAAGFGIAFGIAFLMVLFIRLIGRDNCKKQ